MKRISSAICFLVLALTLASSCKTTSKTARQHRDLVKTYETLKKEMAEAMVTMEGEKVKVVLPEALLFPVNSSDLNQSYLPILGKMCKVLNKYEQTSIMIAGFTDVSGSESLNNQLSQKRADNTKAVLMKNKVEDARIETWGMGATEPIASNKTEEGRKQNRRVEFIITYKPKDLKK